MDSYNIFDLYVCPRCGKITVMPAQERCPYCQRAMVKHDKRLDDVFIQDPIQFVDRITAQYYKGPLYDKGLWKERKKNDSRIIKLHNSIVWKMSLSAAIKICPQCARIVTQNYLIEGNRCTRCGVPYKAINVTGLDYYSPDIKGEQYIYNKIKTEMEAQGIRGEINLPSNKASAINNDPLLMGVFPALVMMPGKTAAAKERLSGFISNYLSVVNACCKELDKQQENTVLLDEFSHIINHIHNVLRGQSFLGQGRAVTFWQLIFIEIEQKYFDVGQDAD